MDVPESGHAVRPVASQKYPAVHVTQAPASKYWPAGQLVITQAVCAAFGDEPAGQSSGGFVPPVQILPAGHVAHLPEFK